MSSEVTLGERNDQDKAIPRPRGELLAEYEVAAEVSRIMGRPLITVDEMQNELSRVIR